MARPRTARLQTAYDLGHEHGRTGSRPDNADDIIGSDPDMQQAYDDGLAAGTDSLDTPSSPGTASPRARAHRARPTSPQGPRRTSSAAKPRATKTAAAARTGSGQRFSHPLHWGSGARGHVVGRPRLTPPRGVSVRDWTGFGFGLFLYALGAAYITIGPGGPSQWFKAKFFNKTPGDTAPSPYAKTPAQLAGGGIIAPGAKGVKVPPATGPGANLTYIQGSDGLWYPVTDPSKIKVGGP